MHHAIKALTDWYLQSLDSGGYLLVALLMIMESSIVPLPSEVVIPPAALQAFAKGGVTAVIWVVVAGAIGSWIGASLMYWISRWAGRPFILKYGRHFRITPERVVAAETWAAQYGPFGVFFSRLLPVVRHLIGIPAGLARMNFVRYSVYTLAGSTLWCGILAWLGVKAGQDQALMHGELHRVLLWIVGACVVLGVIYYAFVHRQMKKARSPSVDLGRS